MSANSLPNLTENATPTSASNNHGRSSDYYIFAPDGLILAYPPNNSGTSSRRSSASDFSLARLFPFGQLFQNLS